MKAFNDRSISITLTQSKNGESLHNLFKTFTFKINTIYITNLKMKNNNYRREKIDEILWDSKIINNNLDKHDKKTNKIFNTIGINS